MISYYQLTNIEKNIRDVQKLGRKLSKLAKNGKKLVLCVFLTQKNQNNIMSGRKLREP